MEAFALGLKLRLDAELEKAREALADAMSLISFIRDTKQKGCEWLSRTTTSLEAKFRR